MINEMKYRYTEIGIRNVMMAEDLSDPCIETVVHPALTPLLEKLAAVRPTWKFIGHTRALRSEGPRFAFRFRVYDGQEELGEVATEYRGEGQAFRIDNPRLQAKRVRGYATYTKDLNKAFKLVIKSFGSKTSNERLTEAAEKAEEAVKRAAVYRRSLSSHAYFHLQDAIRDFALDNWEVFADVAKAKGVVATALEEFPTLYEDYAAAKVMEEAFDDKRGTLVYVRGSEYFLRTGGEVKLATSEELPDHVRRAVGMLKLSEDGQFIPNMGVRAKEDVFYVVPAAGEVK